MARKYISDRTLSYKGNPYQDANMMSKWGWGYNKAQVSIFHRSQYLRGKATTEAQLRRIGQASYRMHQIAKGVVSG